MSQQEKVIALGFFDGVHRGHGALLRRAAEEAERRGVASAVFTFDRPPKEVVTGIPCPLLNSPEDRAELVRRLYNIQEVIMAPFDEAMMKTSWQDFLRKLLVEEHHAVHLVAGHDHRFGHKNQGTPELLARECAALGLGCDIIPKVEIDGVTVSSTYIRSLVEAGEMERASLFLGHPHTLTQEVRHGRRIGRTIGVPTVNLTVPPRVLTPMRGVYVCRAVLPDGSRFAAVTNVGVRPTVHNGDDVTVEAWLQGFEGDLYGQRVRLEFCRRLRGEIAFPSLEELRRRISADAEEVRRYFEEHPL